MSSTNEESINNLGAMIEELYNLQPPELRKLAFEALLISDGPDKIDGDPEGYGLDAKCVSNPAWTTFTLTKKPGVGSFPDK